MNRRGPAAEGRGSRAARGDAPKGPTRRSGASGAPEAARRRLRGIRLAAAH